MLRNHIVAFKEGGFELHELIVSQSVNKEEYKTRNIAYEVLKRLCRRYPGEHVMGLGVRVAYIVCAGLKGAKHWEMARSPQEVIDQGLPIDMPYYEERILTVLERFMSVVLGEDGWREFVGTLGTRKPYVARIKKGNLSWYFGTPCGACGGPLGGDGGDGGGGGARVCARCLESPEELRRRTRERRAECGTVAKAAVDVCVGCAGPDIYSKCRAWDCPQLYRRLLAMDAFVEASTAFKDVEAACRPPSKP